MHATEPLSPSEGVFTLEQSQAVLDQFTSTFFRHFKLYKCVLAPPVEMHAAFRYTGHTQSTIEMLWTDLCSADDVPAQPEAPEVVEAVSGRGIVVCCRFASINFIWT